MLRRARARVVVPVILVLLSAACAERTASPAAEESSAAAPPRSVHFTAAGDFGSRVQSDAVLDAMATRDADLALALGDLSYGPAGEETQWCRRVSDRLGDEYPFQLLAGNHESEGNGKDAFIDDFAACLPNRLPNLVGTYPREWYADVPADDPLVRFVMISPGLVFPDGLWSYDRGTAHHEWTAKAIDDARAAGIPWVVVGAHNPCATVGVHRCNSGRQLFDLLLEKKVDLVLHGHEHHYARTHQLALGDDCRSVPLDHVDDDCLRDDDAPLSQGAGTVFVTVGTGGVNLREVDTADPEWGYFAAVSAAGRDPAHGLLDVEVTADKLRARFIPIGRASYSDAFRISR